MATDFHASGLEVMGSIESHHSLFEIFLHIKLKTNLSVFDNSKFKIFRTYIMTYDQQIL